MRSLPILLTALVFFGCGGEGSPVGDDTDPVVGDDDDDVVGDDDDDDSGTCNTWIATYDLTGRRFFIDALMDFTITLQEPYGADANMGPGTITIRIADDGGAMAPGPAWIIDYALTQDFVTGNAVASVHTDLDNLAVNECGVASGTLDGTTLSWAPEAMVDHCQNGQISCVGAFCGTAGSPPEGQPEVIVDDCGDQPVKAFDFSADLSTFTMDAMVISQDNNATAALAYVGTLVSSELDSNTPACLCP
jgi:hypothetical protein